VILACFFDNFKPEKNQSQPNFGHQWPSSETLGPPNDKNVKKSKFEASNKYDPEIKEKN